jgi:ParB-like chromosome segregation protein Spo0J
MTKETIVKGTRPKRKLVQMQLCKLRSHPSQASLYASRKRWQIDDLAASMDKEGLLEPVETTPDGTIISGHGRVEAARRLGWKTILCWVREDLAAEGEEAVEARLIEANLHRRHLSKLDMVRCYRRLKEMERNSRGRKKSAKEVAGDVRDLIAQRFGVSGRTLDRWLQVLELPLPLQEAVEDGRLALVVAVRVQAHDAEQQSEIAKQVADGEDPKAVVAKYLAPPDRRHRNIRDALRNLTKMLQRGIDDLSHRVDDVDSDQVEPHLPIIKKARRLLRKLVAVAAPDE